LAGEEKAPDGGATEKAAKPREAPKPKLEAVDASEHPWVRSIRAALPDTVESRPASNAAGALLRHVDLMIQELEHRSASDPIDLGRFQ